MQTKTLLSVFSFVFVMAPSKTLQCGTQTFQSLCLDMPGWWTEIITVGLTSGFLDMVSETDSDLLTQCSQEKPVRM